MLFYIPGKGQETVQLLDSIIQYYYDEGNDSTPSWKWEYQYNTAEIQTYHGIYFWSDSHWNLFENQQNIFDEKGIITETILYEGEPETLNWVIRGRKHYFNHDISTGLEIFKIDKIELFPNPTTGIINITGLTHPAEVKVYSIHGQLLKSEQQVINSINISDLPGGVYYLNLSYGDEVINKTIIVTV